MKLYYFNLYGRAENIRLILHIAKAEYEDVRIEFKDWPEFKKDHEKLEYGQMPVLEVDGKYYSQSGAIRKYLARKYGLYPTDTWEQYLTDNIEESLVDFFTGLLKMKDLKGEEKKTAFEAFVTTTAKNCFRVWEQRLQDNSSQEFIIGDKLTYADTGFITLYANVLNRGETKLAFADILDAHPTVKSYMETRYAALKDYFDNRPDCPF